MRIVFLIIGCLSLKKKFFKVKEKKNVLIYFLISIKINLSLWEKFKGLKMFCKI